MRSLLEGWSAPIVGDVIELDESLDLGNVAPLTLPWVSDPWGRLRPPLSVEAVRMSARLAEATYRMDVNPWLQAGWRDVTIQVDGELTDGFEPPMEEKSPVRWLTSVWKLHRVRRRIERRNPIGQMMGVLRQREMSNTGKVLVMIHPAAYGRYVVAISFMGTGSRLSDWVSNFRMSTESGIHKGFLQLARQFEGNESDIAFSETARELGLEKLTLSHILEEAKSPNSRFILWLTGHSQGGALTQVYAYHKIQEDGVLPANIVGYGFASPSIMTGLAIREPAAYPLYHVLNSEDVVPRMGSQMHLGLCLIYPAGEEIRRRCYAWPRDEKSIHQRMTARPIVRMMKDTPSCIEVAVAYMTELSRRSPEDVMEGLKMLETHLPMKRVLAAADSRLDDLMRYACRHMAAAYESITGQRMNQERVARIRVEIDRVMNELGVKSLTAALGQLMGEPHHMSAKHDGFMGAYTFIAEDGVEELIPAFWQGGRPPRLVRAGEALQQTQQEERPVTLYNQHRQQAERRIHRHPRYATPRRRTDTRHHLPTLRPGGAKAGERIIRPRR